MTDRTLLYYEPTEDGYARLFGSLDDVNAYIEWDEFGYVKTDENTILIYGYTTLFTGVRKLKKTDEGLRQDKDWSFQPQLVKFEIHKNPWKDKRGENTPQCHEQFMFDWLTGNLKEGEIYKGKIDFNPSYNQIYDKINASILTGNLDEGLLKLCIEAYPVESPEKATVKPSGFKDDSGKKGKSFKSKFEQAKEMFPNLFKDSKTLEECVYTAVVHYSAYREEDPSESLALAIAIKTCFGYDIPFEWNETEDGETQQSAIAKASTTPKQTTVEKQPDRSTKPEKPSFSELLARSNVELQRLHWGIEDAQKELKERYRVTSRQKLTDEQMLDFVEYLESMAAF